MKYSRNEALLATGEKIREERKNRNLNQKQFSEMLVKNFAIKADRSKIAKWETGRLHIQDDELIVLAKCFNVTTDYLLGLSETKSTDPKVKEICEYTGLSEDAISLLHRTKNRTSSIASIILSNSNFYAMLARIENYRQLIDNARSNEEWLINGDYNPAIDVPFTQEGEKADFELFQIQKLLYKIVEGGANNGNNK